MYQGIASEEEKKKPCFAVSFENRGSRRSPVLDCTWRKKKPRFVVSFENRGSRFLYFPWRKKKSRKTERQCLWQCLCPCPAQFCNFLGGRRRAERLKEHGYGHASAHVQLSFVISLEEEEEQKD
jgi:hypothetical protein